MRTLQACLRCADKAGRGQSERQEARNVGDSLVVEQRPQHAPTIHLATDHVLGLAVPGQQAVSTGCFVHFEGLAGGPVLGIKRCLGAHGRNVRTLHASHEGVALVEFQFRESRRRAHLQAARPHHSVRRLAALEDAAHLTLTLQLLQQYSPTDDVQQDAHRGIGPCHSAAAHDNEPADALVPHHTCSPHQPSIVDVSWRRATPRVGTSEDDCHSASKACSKRGAIGDVGLADLYARRDGGATTRRRPAARSRQRPGAGAGLEQCLHDEPTCPTICSQHCDHGRG
mmetsp:Transcript_59068/g.149995  ORF Transcript_59068/g.149995 Transcript_59068/m.149995 type:complete len:284 (-) Transcript_59068:244-1095(-)